MREIIKDTEDTLPKLLKRNYEGDQRAASTDIGSLLSQEVAKGEIDAQSLLAGYCYMLYERLGTFEEVARLVQLDRRTVKKYIEAWKENPRNKS